MKDKKQNNLETVLNRALILLYRTGPDGVINYGTRKDYLVGNIHFGGFNDCPMKSIRLEYRPVNHGIYSTAFGYVSSTIATIDLKNKTYSTKWNNHNEDYWKIPKVLMKDTERVMRNLGLKRIKK